MFEGLREADTDGVIRVRLLQFENSIFTVRLNVVLMQHFAKSVFRNILSLCQGLGKRA